MVNSRRNRYWLDKKAKRGFQGHPVATIAYYGPDDRHATKAVVGILNPQNEVISMEKWFSKDYEDIDVRVGSAIIQSMLEFIEQQNVQSVAISEGIIGCPHEEGIDYPEGAVCPECAFWANRNRWG